MAENGRKIEKRALAERAGLTLCDDQRILVVDDERAIRTVFQRILVGEFPDHQIDMASNGLEGLDFQISFPPAGS